MTAVFWVGCEPKARHPSKSVALRAKSRLPPPNPKAGKRLSVYRCPRCDGWHVGHYRRAS